MFKILRAVMCTYLCLPFQDKMRAVALCKNTHTILQAYNYRIPSYVLIPNSMQLLSNFRKCTKLRKRTKDL